MSDGSAAQGRSNKCKRCGGCTRPGCTCCFCPEILEAENKRLKAEVKSLERFRDLRTRHNQELEDRTKELIGVKAERDDYGRQAWDARVLAGTLHAEALESAKRGYGLGNYTDGPRMGTGPLADYEAKLDAIWKSSGIDRPDPSCVPCTAHGCDYPALQQTIVAPKCLLHKAPDRLPSALRELHAAKEYVEILRGALHRILQAAEQVKSWVERNGTEHVIRVKMAPVLKELQNSACAGMAPLRSHPSASKIPCENPYHPPECHGRLPICSETNGGTEGT